MLSDQLHTQLTSVRELLITINCFPNFVPGSLVFGAAYDAGFELLSDGGGTPTEESSWGELKNLYR